MRSPRTSTRSAQEAISREQTETLMTGFRDLQREVKALRAEVAQGSRAQASAA
jgi:hypothetical protein